MEHDPELVAETRAWLVKAQNDIRAAEALVGTSPPLLEEALFHCQQAAEKSLKRFLTWHGEPFRKTHNLEETGEQCQRIDLTLREVVDQATPLTEYAWRFRYPGELELVTMDEFVTTVTVAKRLYDAVSSRLPDQARP